MLSCKSCKTKINSVDLFFAHVRYCHQLTEYVKCPYETCTRIYSDRSSLKKHLRIHPLDSVSIEIKEKQVNNLLQNNDVKKTNEKLSEIILNLKKEMMKHVLELLSDELITVKKSLEISRKSFEAYSKAFLSLKEIENQFESETSNLQEFYEFFSEPSSVQSEFKLKKALITAGIYLPSKDFTISSFNVLKFVNSVPKLLEEKRIVKMFDVPNILQNFFNLPNIIAELFSYFDTLKSCTDGPISNIIQSPLWKKLLDLEKVSDDSILYLPVNVYFDDFEPLNVVGSHSGAYKVGATYLGLPFLPDHIISKLEYIFPVALFFSEDRNDVGNDEIFKPIVNMLNYLYTNGIAVKFKNIRTIKFIVTLILGDNLGLNGILSFSEGFNHNYYCRFCKLPKNVMQKQLFEDSTYLRNCQNYSADLLCGNFSLTGIKGPSIFNTICRFHVTRNFSVDILHDFFEGVCHYDLCNIIKNLVDQKVFTLDELNANIRYHNYGPFVKNKTLDSITFEMLTKNKIRSSGEEMHVLVASFAFIIGHRVNKDCPEWRLYVVLRRILSIVTAKTIHRRTHEYLSDLITQHHNLYLQCFPDDTLKPKHHFMIHYPRIMQYIGPLSSVSCMRYESYHKKFKNVSKVVSCRINLLTTFAKKIEYQLSYFFLYFEKTLKEPKFGKFEDMDKISLFRKYGFASDSNKIVVSGFVDFGGILIKRNCVVQIGKEVDDTPVFGLISDVIVEDDNKILLGCQKIFNFGFTQHFYAFSVCVEKEFHICQFSKDFFRKVSYIVDGSDHKKYVSF